MALWFSLLSRDKYFFVYQEETGLLKLVGFPHAYWSDLFWSVYMFNLVV
jgi:hypothetical protein